MAMKRKLLYIALFIVSVVVGGLGWGVWEYTTWLRPIACRQFIDRQLRAVDFTQLRPGVERDWIDHFWLKSSRVTAYSHYDGKVTWQWYFLGNRYSLYSLGENIWLRQSWEYSEVRIEDMLRCLGQPDAYLSVAERGPDAHLHTVSFVYEKSGYIVTGMWFYKTEPVPVTLDIPLLYVDIVPAGDAKTMVGIAYADWPEWKGGPQGWLNAVEPWPGDLSKIRQTPIIIHDQRQPVN